MKPHPFRPFLFGVSWYRAGRHSGPRARAEESPAIVLSRISSRSNSDQTPSDPRSAAEIRTLLEVKRTSGGAVDCFGPTRNDPNRIFAPPALGRAITKFHLRIDDTFGEVSLGWAGEIENVSHRFQPSARFCAPKSQ